MKVFFAVDGSPGSLVAVQQAGQLLTAAQDEAALYFAPPEVVVRHAAAGEEMRARARQAIADVVFAEAKSKLPSAVAAKAVTILAEHTAAEGIRIESEKWGAQLIVIGARSAVTTLEAMFLGSVSHAVAQTSKIPVLVVRPKQQAAATHPIRVLYAYDGSTGSSAALATAKQLSWPSDAQVVALTVVEALTAGEIPDWLMKKARDADAEAMASHWEREFEDDKRQARDQLADVMHKQAPPFAAAEIVCAAGHAAEQIIKLVAERNIDVVLLGSHGKGMLSRLLVGSTSSKVLNQAACSVLIARGT